MRLAHHALCASITDPRPYGGGGGETAFAWAAFLFLPVVITVTTKPTSGAHLGHMLACAPDVLRSRSTPVASIESPCATRRSRPRPDVQASSPPPGFARSPFQIFRATPTPCSERQCSSNSASASFVNSRRAPRM